MEALVTFNIFIKSSGLQHDYNINFLILLRPMEILFEFYVTPPFKSAVTIRRQKSVFQKNFTISMNNDV